MLPMQAMQHESQALGINYVQRKEADPPDMYSSANAPNARLSLMNTYIEYCTSNAIYRIRRRSIHYSNSSDRKERISYLGRRSQARRLTSSQVRS